MEDIKRYDYNEVDLKNHLQRIGDIINLDGPMLSLFQDERNKELYLFDWVDSNDTTNRWLIYNISAEILNKFLLNKISYKEMFDSIKEDIFYCADIVNAENIEYSIYGLKYLPENYIPTKEVFFDKNDSINYNHIVDTINKIIFKESKGNAISVNRIDTIENYRISKESFLFLYDQGFLGMGPDPDAESANELKNPNITTIEIQPNVRENNRLPKKEGMDVYTFC